MRFGVIGWGLRRRLALLFHDPTRDRRLVALADPDPVARDRFRAEVEGEPRTFEDYRSLLDLGLDAVLILSPDWLHEEHALGCLEAGIPVYLEKPMAITTEGCDRILAAARKTGTPLFVGHNMRHYAFVRKMRAWIEQGRIGEPKTAWCRHFVAYGGEAYFRDWHADRRKSTGLLLQKGCHDIDVLHYLCGAYARRVTAMGALMVYRPRERGGEAPSPPPEHEFGKTWPPASLGPLAPVVDVEDVSLVLMELDNGVLASYQQCHFSPDAWRNTTVIGDRGRIENFDDAPGRCVVRLWDRFHFGLALPADEEYAVPPAEGPHGGADALILEEFSEFLRTGRTSVSSVYAARMAVAVGEAATRSLRAGAIPVDVPPLPADI